jgi:hypothetical protein
MMEDTEELLTDEWREIFFLLMPELRFEDASYYNLRNIRDAVAKLSVKVSEIEKTLGMGEHDGEH